MSWIEAIVLGITQGLTEFLPISSSGHLIIVPWLFGWETPGLAYDAALHLGTLLAVFAYFWRDLLAIIRSIPIILTERGALLKPPGRREDESTFYARLGLLLAIASIPGGIVGLLTQSRIEDFFHSVDQQDRAIVVIAIFLAGFGLLLGYADRKGKENRDLKSVTLKDSLIIGAAQCIALMPGVSRSGITLTAGLFRNFKRADAARFSFLVGIPLVTLAGFKGLADLIQANPSGEEIGYIVVGMTASALTGFAAIWGLLRFLQSNTTAVFVVYRVVLAMVLIGLVASGFR